MLDMLATALATLGFGFGDVQRLNPVDKTVWSETANSFDAWSDTAFQVAVQRPDPQAKQIVAQYLQSLNAAGNPVGSQSVLVQIGSAPIAAHQATNIFPAASLTKVATTLAALNTWDPNHRFETVIAATGPVENGVLQGDLVVLSQGDPLFVWEEGIALGNALQAAGIQQVSGNLLVTPAFTMNFSPDPVQSGQWLQQAFNAEQWEWEAEQQFATLPPNTPRPQIIINGGVQVVAPSAPILQSATPVVSHKSLSLFAILKSMNIYSNNEMSEQIARLIGGPAVVSSKAAQAAGIPAEHIQLINGSGLGQENQISAIAVVQMFRAIQLSLEQSGFNVADLFPVFGRDGGTLDYRSMPIAATVKTGTLNGVCTLAGVLPTRDRGLVWFAIFNQGYNIEGLREQQDQLLQALSQHWGIAQPLPEDITPSALPEAEQLGAASRNQVI